MKNVIKTLALTTAVLALSACATNTTSNGLEGYKETFATTYQCGKDKVSAKFLNDEFNSIAIISVNNESPALLTNAISGSGAKYQGGIYELWTKGETATFTNLLKSPNKNIQCKTAS